METEGPQGDEGRTGGDPPSNVVLFPRDWFGPKDELVPLGPRAAEAEAVEVEAVSPVRPDDFWGEDSAAIHDVLQAPVAGAGDSIENGHRSSARRLARGWLKFAVMYARAKEAAARVPRVGRVAVPRVGRRSASVAFGGLAVVLCVVAVIGRVEGSIRTPRAHVRIAAAGRVEAAARPAGHWWRGRLLLVSHRVPAGGRGHARATKLKSVSRASSPQPSASSAGGAVPPPTYVSTPAASSSAPAEGSSSTGGGGGGASAAAGPRGAGAPFGPGHLG